MKKGQAGIPPGPSVNYLVAVLPWAAERVESIRRRLNRYTLRQSLAAARHEVNLDALWRIRVSSRLASAFLL